MNGTATNYTLHGKQIVHLAKGGDSLHFFYDAQGRPSVVDFNGTKYGYVHNLQGDVIAIIDGNGTQAVEYTYDAWGKPLTKTGTLATTLGTLNPFRYRSYVYDEETGLYYLRSRYYLHGWCRFLNADCALGQNGGLLQHNLFTYCLNTPIRLADADGHMAFEAAPSLSSLTLKAFEYLGISLPELPYKIIEESTDSNNVTTVILQYSTPVLGWAKSIVPTRIFGADDVTTYTYQYTWEYYRNVRDSYEYYSVNSDWVPFSLAIGEIIPIAGAAITSIEDFVVKPEMKKTPHTSAQDRLRKIFKLQYSYIETERIQRMKE